jgi:hypothetical protein
VARQIAMPGMITSARPARGHGSRPRSATDSGRAGPIPPPPRGRRCPCTVPRRTRIGRDRGASVVTVPAVPTSPSPAPAMASGTSAASRARSPPACARSESHRTGPGSPTPRRGALRPAAGSPRPRRPRASTNSVLPPPMSKRTNDSEAGEAGGDTLSVRGPRLAGRPPPPRRFGLQARHELSRARLRTAVATIRTDVPEPARRARNSATAAAVRRIGSGSRRPAAPFAGRVICCV